MTIVTFCLITISIPSLANANESVKGTVTRLQSYVSPDGQIIGVLVRTSAGMPTSESFNNCGSSGSFILDKDNKLFSEIYSFLLAAYISKEEVMLYVGECLVSWPKVISFVAGDI